ncbi:mannan-binding family protein [Mycobacterium koreense]|uniref:Mannan-binding protein domain-containing protein n=1 Tax=Mycolicibacillus koreensis TaxID=1069220 RepID=A0A7I7SEM5_9MYCO|nr:mannan-binding lectin [Mycolicibacillus koreensis]MCV7249955.1 mannan-binding family protein [Mycolicibacillus koreensis]OSC34829.1 hypothetical protein B8W67_04705 [Mycolicibacillus koreensis]BBY54689.1 hypothetical protein MKOR_19400 [Mycolicibacillus koreensis]
MRALASAAVAALAVVAAPLVTAPRAGAAADQFCAELHADWDGQHCTTVLTSPRQAQRVISVDLPGALLDDPTAGPVVRDFYRQLMDGWRSSGTDSLRDTRAYAYYELHAGPGPVQSLVVHEVLEPHGMQPNNAFRTFVFDMQRGTRLTLPDVFKHGVDPAAVIPSVGAPELTAALDNAAPPHAPNTYPFTLAEFTPGPNGPGYSGNYRTFALTPEHLVLFMPGTPLLREDPQPPDRFVWSMDGGAAIARIPLSSLADALRPEYGGH